jgi:hypothetical protein
MGRNPDELDSMLRHSFVEGANWPIDRPSLRALSRMGLTVAQIARISRSIPLMFKRCLITADGQLRGNHSGDGRRGVALERQ